MEGILTKKLKAGGFALTCVIYLILISLPDLDDGGLSSISRRRYLLS
jgi:hypothetical protein